MAELSDNGTAKKATKVISGGRQQIQHSQVRQIFRNVQQLAGYKQQRRRVGALWRIAALELSRDPG